jgi:hypothetical protein
VEPGARTLSRPWLLLTLLIPLVIGAEATDCAVEEHMQRATVRFAPTGKVTFPEGPDAYALPIDTQESDVEEICVNASHVVCEWENDINELRPMESHGPTTWGRDMIETGDTVVDNLVRCATGTSLGGVCEDWLGALGNNHSQMSSDSKMVSVFDRGLCSATLPTELFTDLVLNEFKKQAEERLGTNRDPNGEDVILWTDFVVGLKKSDKPFRAWTDWRHGHLAGYSSTADAEHFRMRSEIVVEANYYVDGNLDWRIDPDRFGDTTAGAALAISLQALWYANPLTFWTVFVGNCEKDRPLRVRFRGEWAATSDGGVGLKVNTSRTCGPNNDGPCTWASVLDWPARPLCNNRVKPEIENNFVTGIAAGLTDPETGEPRCLTCRQDGGSLIPFALYNEDTGKFEPLKVKRVVQTPAEMVFVFVDDVMDPLYPALKNLGLCNYDRPAANSDYVELPSEGSTL